MGLGQSLQIQLNLQENENVTLVEECGQRHCMCHLSVQVVEGIVVCSCYMSLHFEAQSHILHCFPH